MVEDDGLHAFVLGAGCWLGGWLDLAWEKEKDWKLGRDRPSLRGVVDRPVVIPR